MSVHKGIHIVEDPEVIGVGAGVHPEIHTILAENGYRTTEMAEMEDPDDIIHTIRDKQIGGIITRTNINLTDPKIFRQVPELGVIFAACRDPRINIPGAVENGVWVLRPDTNTSVVAGKVMSAINGLADGTLPGVASTRTAHWSKSEVSKSSFEVPGKTLGIVGFGKIGQKTATLAVDAGMNVVVYNDGPHNNLRRYHRKLRDAFTELERRNPHVTVRWADTMGDVFDKVDIISLHVNSEDFEGSANDGIITREHLERLQGDGRLGILINFARRNFVGMEDKEIFELVKSGILRYYISDVSEPEREGKGKYVPGIDMNHPEAFRFMITPHIGGSGPTLARRTVQDVGDKLVPGWKDGYFDTDWHFGYKRHSMSLSVRNDGDLIVQMTTSTQKGIIATLTSMLAEFGSLGDSESISDTRDGTCINHEWVPRIFVVTPNGVTAQIRDAIHNVIDRLGDLNEAGWGIKTARIIPTNDEQRRIVRAMQFST